MRRFLKDLISDDNKLNEKSFAGFIALAAIIVITIADIVTGIMHRELTIHRWIFEGLLLFAASALAIGSFDKWINKDGKTNSNEGDSQG